MNRLFRCLSHLVMGLFLLPPCLGAEAETSPDYDARLRWWREARFGLFVHWGPVSLKGTEIGWSRGAQVPVEEYDRLYQQFNPVRFKADAWVKVAKQAGMKYLVFTSKHHDGFSMWNTRSSDYNIMKSPFGRDVIKELAAACRKHKITFCTYHSICDWRHPDYPLGSPGGQTAKPNPNLDRYNQFLKDQVAELICDYGPLGVLWFDGEWEKPWTTERGQELYRHVRALQPNIIVNNRVSPGRQGLDGTTAAGFFRGDFDTPEQQIGQFQTAHPWESCITICEQWAWKPNDKLKSLKQCLQTLISCAGGDGNLLLNVGPMPTGEIEPRQVERLHQIGQWLRKHGRSIYCTRGGPFKPGKWGASTHRGRTVYVHVFEWPAEGLNLPPLDQRVVKARVRTGGKVDVQQTSAGLSLRLVKGQPDPLDTLIELSLSAPVTVRP